MSSAYTAPILHVLRFVSTLTVGRRDVCPLTVKLQALKPAVSSSSNVRIPDSGSRRSRRCPNRHYPRLARTTRGEHGFQSRQPGRGRVRVNKPPAPLGRSRAGVARRSLSSLPDPLGRRPREHLYAGKRRAPCRTTTRGAATSRAKEPLTQAQILRSTAPRLRDHAPAMGGLEGATRLSCLGPGAISPRQVPAASASASAVPALWDLAGFGVNFGQ